MFKRKPGKTYGGPGYVERTVPAVIVVVSFKGCTEGLQAAVVQHPNDHRTPEAACNLCSSGGRQMVGWDGMQRGP